MANVVMNGTGYALGSSPHISVIIPAKNEEERIKALLKDLSRQSLRHKGNELTLETIVADGASTDTTAEIAKAHNALVVEGGSPSAGRNNGAVYACGDILYFIDADVRIKNPRFVANSYLEFKKRELDIAGVRILPAWEKTENTLDKFSLALMYGVTDLYLRIFQFTSHPLAQGGCMIVKKNSFNEVNGFNADTYWGEDSELAEKMVSCGCKFGILPFHLSVHASTRNQMEQGVINYYRNQKTLNEARRRGIKIDITTYQSLTRRQSYFSDSVNRALKS